MLNQGIILIYRTTVEILQQQDETKGKENKLSWSRLWEIYSGNLIISVQPEDSYISITCQMPESFPLLSSPEKMQVTFGCIYMDFVQVDFHQWPQIIILKKIRYLIGLQQVISSLITTKQKTILVETVIRSLNFKFVICTSISRYVVQAKRLNLASKLRLKQGKKVHLTILQSITREDTKESPASDSYLVSVGCKTPHLLMHTKESEDQEIQDDYYLIEFVAHSEFKHVFT